MATSVNEEVYLSHSGQEIDDNIDEVVAARGSSASLSAALSALQTAINGKAAVSDIFGAPTIWDSTSGTIDLNSITTVGRYVTSGTTISEAIVHRPDYENAGSKLVVVEVMNFTASGIMQKLYAIRGTTYGTVEIFFRAKTGGEWRDWYKVTTSTVNTYEPQEEST